MCLSWMPIASMKMQSLNTIPLLKPVPTEKYVRNGAMWLDVGTPTERLAGANITLMDGVRNVINWGNSLEDALTMATLTPAQNLGVATSVGSIETGKTADLVIVDENLSVQTVILRGKPLKN